MFLEKAFVGKCLHGGHLRETRRFIGMDEWFQSLNLCDTLSLFYLHVRVFGEGIKCYVCMFVCICIIYIYLYIYAYIYITI